MLLSKPLLAMDPLLLNRGPHRRHPLGVPAEARLVVYDVAGRAVRTLVAGLPQVAGRYEAAWDGRDDAGRACASGVYIYRLEAGAAAESGKMALLR